MGDKIQILQEDIRIRPSAVDGFFGCAFQWGKVFLEGKTSIPSARAAIGTAIHAAVEEGWKESMEKGDKSFNLSSIIDAGMESWKEETQKGVQYGKDEDEKSCMKEILVGTECFVEDIVPFSEIPIGVETFYKVDIDHPLVSEVGGTIDYETASTVGDVKTSKRKPSPGNYRTQQSTYKFLAKANGRDIKRNIIQGVILKKQPEGVILPLEANEQESKDLINIMLDTLRLVAEDKMPIELLLRPNPKYTFCSQAFCAFYGDCPGTKARELMPQVSHPKI